MPITKQSDPFKQIAGVARRQGTLRSRDLAQLDIPHRRVALLVEQGVMLRSGRGL